MAPLHTVQESDIPLHSNCNNQNVDTVYDQNIGSIPIIYNHNTTGTIILPDQNTEASIENMGHICNQSTESTEISQ